MLAGLLRAINKCRCQHPPLDPRLSHVSSPSRSLSISFSVRPLSPSSFPPSLSRALLHDAPRSSFRRSRGTTLASRYNGRKSRERVRVYLCIPKRSCTLSPRERATGDGGLRNYRRPKRFARRLYPRLRNDVAVRRREPRDARLIFSLRGGEREPIFAPTREKLKGFAARNEGQAHHL